MNVITCTNSFNSVDGMIRFYKLDTGHEAIYRSFGLITVTTRSGNYASQITALKVKAAIHAYNAKNLGE